MCFHSSQTKTTMQLEKRYRAKRANTPTGIGEHEYTFYHANGFAHRELLIIPQEEIDTLQPAIWGIMPEYETQNTKAAYFKKAARYGGGLNARSEKLFDHFLYQEVIHQQRCIIPLTGFFEPHQWQGQKIPYFIRRKDGNTLSVAGIYSVTTDGVISTSILTKKASPMLAEIHNEKLRQPVLLDPSWENQWLEDDLTAYQIKELIQLNYPDNDLEAYTVSKDLFKRNVESNKEAIIQKVVYN